MFSGDWDDDYDENGEPIIEKDFDLKTKIAIYIWIAMIPCGVAFATWQGYHKIPDTAPEFCERIPFVQPGDPKYRNDRSWRMPGIDCPYGWQPVRWD